MLRSIYLVARRDYLGYVTAWGFWLGLMITPVLFGIGLVAPSLAASSAPVRHFTVIDNTGAYTAVIEKEMERRAVNLARGVVEASELISSDEDAVDRFDAEIEAGADPQDALEAALPGMADRLQLPQDDFRLVDPPAETIEGLRPWLNGDRMLDTGRGSAPLFAAIVYTPDGIEYWSKSVNFSGIQSLARRSARALAQDQVFSANSVPDTVLDQIDSRTLDVIDKKLNEDGTGGSEVTLADRARARRLSQDAPPQSQREILLKLYESCSIDENGTLQLDLPGLPRTSSVQRMTDATSHASSSPSLAPRLSAAASVGPRLSSPARPAPVLSARRSFRDDSMTASPRRSASASATSDRALPRSWDVST
ncbi:MAG: hypothetical protein AAF216_07080, partial [Pseudomonadota bacterium]